MAVVASRLGELPGSAYAPGDLVAALTFDDGPGPHTDAVIDALAACDAPATFFVVGGECGDRPEVLARIGAAGHTIGCHSWSHTRLSSLADDDVRDEFTRTADAVRALTGRSVVHARPPYRKADAPRLAALLGPLGWRAVVTWSVDPEDWRDREPRDVAAAVADALHPGAIVLLHDGGGARRRTAAAVPEIVAAGRSRGYRFVAL